MYTAPLTHAWFACRFPGGLFGEGDEHRSVENAFRYAVYRINHDRQLLPDTKLGYDIQHLPTNDGFKASKKGKGGL